MAEVLSDIDIINGIFTLGMVLINSGVGFILVLKSNKFKNRALLFMGISLVLLVSPWLANSINFVLIITNAQSLSPEVHLAIALLPLPIANVAWMVVITELIFKDKQKPVLALYIIYAIIFDMLVISMLAIDYTLAGTFESPLDTVYSTLISSLILVLLLTVLITSIWFFAETRKAKVPEARLKGTLFLISSTTFVVASILDSRVTGGVAMIIVLRFLLLLGALEVYWAFLLPDYIKKIFLRNK